MIDIAGDGHDGLYALVGSRGARHIVHVDCAGNAAAGFTLDQHPDTSALVFLGRPSRLVVLADEGGRLVWFDPQSGQRLSEIATGTLRSCFHPVALGGDGCARLFLAGTDGAPFGSGAAPIVIADAEGGLLGVVAVDQRPTGAVADHSHLFVSTASGLLRFDPAEAVPHGASEIKASVLTPMLQSPADSVQRWLRVEAEAALPAGCTIEISFGSTADPETRNKLLRGLADPAVPQHQQLEIVAESSPPAPIVSTAATHPRRGRLRSFRHRFMTFAIPICGSWSR